MPALGAPAGAAADHPRSRAQGGPGDPGRDRRGHVPPPSAEHLASWAGLAPGVHESAGKRTPTGAPHGNKWLTSMLVEAAGSVGG
ncbi:transposase [Geodermatophilus sp. URMC 65]